MGKKYINLAIADNVATIQIYCEIGEDWGWDDNEKRAGDLEAFAEQMAQAQAAGVDLIKVRISSPGGDIAHGLPIANLIAQSETPVHTYNDGLCYSMAAVILAAGQKVFAAENSKIMLHSARTFAGGNAKELEAELEVLKGYDSTIAGFIAAKTGQPLEDVLGLYFDGADHYLTAKEALDAGLVDELIPAVKEANMLAAIASALGFKAKKAAPKENNPANNSADILKDLEAKNILLCERVAALQNGIGPLKEKIEALEAKLDFIAQKPAYEKETFLGQPIDGKAPDILENLPHNKAADRFFRK